MCTSDVWKKGIYWSSGIQGSRSYYLLSVFTFDHGFLRHWKIFGLNIFKEIPCKGVICQKQINILQGLAYPTAWQSSASKIDFWASAVLPSCLLNHMYCVLRNVQWYSISQASETFSYVNP